MKLHQKGFLLVTLSRHKDLWEQALITETFTEYGLTGAYSEKALRIALDELSAAGLITRIEEKLAQHHGQQQLQFRYQLSDFGRIRMIDTGLLAG
jgi:DNA-binding transcriptional regulator PaaX